MIRLREVYRALIPDRKQARISGPRQIAGIVVTDIPGVFRFEVCFFQGEVEDARVRLTEQVLACGKDKFKMIVRQQTVNPLRNHGARIGDIADDRRANPGLP